tara:strand:+ start:1413 stop:1976 length:564 start_codon:yes stop_codon:yes gene_type:complete
MNRFLLDQEYRVARDTPSDINEHLDLLKSLANEVNHVTEIGTRTGVSTRAFLSSNVILRAYDLSLDARVKELFKYAKDNGKDVEYIKGNILDEDIEETDLLFIDTWHCYEQLFAELTLHAPKVKKYIVFHDTQTFGTSSECFMGQIGSNGLLPAIIHYIIKYPNTWRFKIHRTNNNGLTVIQRSNNY